MTKKKQIQQVRKTESGSLGNQAASYPASFLGWFLLCAYLVVLETATTHRDFQFQRRHVLIQCLGLLIHLLSGVSSAISDGSSIRSNYHTHDGVLPCAHQMGVVATCYFDKQKYILPCPQALADDWWRTVSSEYLIPSPLVDSVWLNSSSWCTNYLNKTPCLQP